MTERSHAASVTTIWPTQIPLGSIVRTRSFVIASVGYFAVLMVLFCPLLKGYCLTSGATTGLAAPFEIPDQVDAVPYVNIWTGDFIQQFGPFEEYQYRSARQGRFPTWNPYIFMGQPFHANGQSAMFFPTHWIYFLINPDLARGPASMMRLWISAAALFCLLRKFSLAPTPAFVGGALWTFGSFNMHWLLWPHSNASLWTPVLLLALDYLLMKPSWRGYAIASLAAAPLFLSGHPGTVYLCGYLVGVYSAIRLLDSLLHGISIRQLTIAMIAGIAAIVTGLLAASAALLPLLIQIRHSFEYLDIAGHRSTPNNIQWKALWLFLMPEIFGRPRGLYPGYAYEGPDNYVEMTLWFGAIAFVLAMTSMLTAIFARFKKRDPAQRKPYSFLLIFGIVTFILSLMIAFRLWPIYDIVAAAPGAQLTNIRRFFVATNFSGAVLTACGLHQLLINRERVNAMLAALIALACCIFTVDFICTQWNELLWRWHACIRAMPATWGPNWHQLMSSMIEEFAGFRMIAGTLILIVGTAILLRIFFLISKRREITASLRYILAAVITLDVLLPAFNLNPITPLHLAVPPAPEILQTMIQQTGDGRTTASDKLLEPNINMHYGYRDVRGYDLPHNQRLVMLFKRLGLNDHDNRSEMTLDRLYPRIEPELATYLNRTCVRTVLARGPDPQSMADMTCLKLKRDQESLSFMNWPRIAGPVNGVVVFSNPNSYPRTYFAKTAVSVSNPDDAMAALLDDSMDLRNRSVFESSQPAISASPTELSPGDVSRITLDNPEQVAIDSQLTSPHMLVLADRMDDGWEVKIDSKPAEALTANYLFRGVFVPAGHHTVEWTYHAPGLAAGVVLSAATVMAMLFLLIASRPRRTSRS